jgi:hypothetical protein
MIYDPDDPPPPFFVKTKADIEKSKEELEWQKIIKPSKSDYKELKDEATWATYKEGFVMTYKAHNMEHLFDESYVPKNETVFASQQRWMYEIMRDKLRASPARKVVYRFADSANVAQLWKELCQELDNSLTQDFRAGKLITYITSADLSDKTVKGGSEAQILFYKNCVRTLHENTPTEEHFTEKQLLKFLEKAVSKVPHLAQVYSQYRVAAKGGGRTLSTLSFEEYVEDLQRAAQVTTNRTRWRNRPPRP